MTSYRDREAVRKIAAEYRMPESYVRHMLAVEAGVIPGDVIAEGPPEPAREGFARRLAAWLARRLRLRGRT